ncbi:phosphatase PAP2 family protein [Neisseria shayeganii]|uniref:Phosphatase PAP2 family protein n=1 Tax=Neisseria shayeganii TaxID=607712 RepID=A0A7D7RLJ6_9NEIS|nr:phosphatase PAP2 family protein [Neisseria shayeganii]QMT39502.1 phosphatase PAP2 family protein [Neisseria shayeganii]
MTAIDYMVNLVLSGILIVGAYQFYFFTQRHPVRAARQFHSAWDERIPFVPWWSWIYSFLYYPAILYLNWLVSDARQFTLLAFSFLMLLFMQMLFFWLLPVSTPAHWRSINTGKTASEKFLLFVQKFDQSSNCFPSMHVSVAMLTALHAAPSLGPAAFAFPLLIALSCLFTKQHYLIDLPAGAALGWLAHRLYLWLLAA